MHSSRTFLFVLSLAVVGISFLPITRHLSPELVQAASTKSIFNNKNILRLFSTAPTSVSIPSIGLSAPVIGLGVNEKGEMDVPNGKTNQVGWYQDGTVPGNTGSAVFDAHVFAAFSNLAQVKAGSDIYVTEGSQTLHFVVATVQEYALSALSPQQLFARSDARRLNLITCAGTYVPALGTYDHRLVVYATLVG